MSTRTATRHIVELSYILQARYGIARDDAAQLRRIALTLHRWDERECGDAYGCIERDEDTGKPYWVNAATMQRSPIPDRERGAIRRLAAILTRYPGVSVYRQSDPRGCALFLYNVSDLPVGADIESCYSSISTAIY